MSDKIYFMKVDVLHCQGCKTAEDRHGRMEKNCDWCGKPMDINPITAARSEKYEDHLLFEDVLVEV